MPTIWSCSPPWTSGRYWSCSLAGRTRILGTITLASHQPGRYTKADLTLAQNLARRTAAAIEHADRAHHPNHPHQPPSRS